MSGQSGYMYTQREITRKRGLRLHPSTQFCGNSVRLRGLLMSTLKFPCPSSLSCPCLCRIPFHLSPVLPLLETFFLVLSIACLSYLMPNIYFQFKVDFLSYLFLFNAHYSISNIHLILISANLQKARYA